MDDIDSGVVRVQVPHDWRDVTPEWMTRALAVRFPQAVVDEVSLDTVQDGTTSRTSAAVTYRTGDGPRRVFLKAQGRLDHRLVVMALRALRPEAQLLLSGQTLPVEMPQTYAIGIDMRRATTILIIEDITERGGHPNIATSPLSVEQVGAGLEGLARLHAKFWERPLPPSLRFLRPWTMASGWTPLAVTGCTLGVHKLRAAGQGDLLPPPIRDRRRLFAAFRRYSAGARTGPLTLLHGDAHVGNTYALPGGVIGFYDWQLVRLGSWCHDVGYFVTTALTTEDRRTHERALLSRYLDALTGAGVSAPPHPAAAWDAYRTTPIYGLNIFLQTLALGDYQTDAVSQTCIRRFASAYEDLETATAQRG